MSSKRDSNDSLSNKLAKKFITSMIKNFKVIIRKRSLLKQVYCFYKQTGQLVHGRSSSV